MGPKKCCDCHKTGGDDTSVSQVDIDFAISAVQKYFDTQLQKARSCFHEIMTKVGDLEDYTKNWFSYAMTKYEGKVTEIWKTFKGTLSKDPEEFQVFELQPAIMEAIDELIHAADHIFGKSAEEEFDEALNKALDEYICWGKSLFPMFNGALRKSMEVEKGKEHEEKLVDWAVENQSTIKAISQLMHQIQNPSAAAEQGKPPSQQEPKSSKSKKSKKKEKVKARKMEKETQYSAMGKPQEQQKKGMDQEQKERQGSSRVEKQAVKQEEEDDDFLPELVDIMEEEEIVVANHSTRGSTTNKEGKEGKGVGQSMDNFERAIADMLKTAKEMNESLISLQKKQEQQEKCFIESLEKKMNEFRIEQIKKIESSMGQLKKKNIK